MNKINKLMLVFFVLGVFNDISAMKNNTDDGNSNDKNIIIKVYNILMIQLGIPQSLKVCKKFFEDPNYKAIKEKMQEKNQLINLVQQFNHTFPCVDTLVDYFKKNGLNISKKIESRETNVCALTGSFFITCFLLGKKVDELKEYKTNFFGESISWQDSGDVTYFLNPTVMDFDNIDNKKHDQGLNFCGTMIEKSSIKEKFNFMVKKLNENEVKDSFSLITLNQELPGSHHVFLVKTRVDGMVLYIDSIAPRSSIITILDETSLVLWGDQLTKKNKNAVFLPIISFSKN